MSRPKRNRQHVRQDGMPKRAFATWGLAGKYILHQEETMHGKKLRAYRCDECGLIHVGHKLAEGTPHD